MLGVKKERLAEWCNHNIDLIISASGATILAYMEEVSNYLNLSPEPNYGFWALLIGVIMLSVGIAALICYRVLPRWHGISR